MAGAGALSRYRKRQDRAVTAVQLRLDTDGFEYRKWGATQRCNPGDWLLDNGGEVYTVEASTFAATYRESSPGRYVKVARVWAERATEAGVIRTKEGATRYAAGDWLVYNEPDRGDGYAMDPETFVALYEAAGTD